MGTLLASSSMVRLISLTFLEIELSVDNVIFILIL